MFFTQDDYKKIQQWLIKNSVKDTEFNEANIPFNGEETITIVQGNQNKKVFLKDLIAQVFNLGISDFVNITDKYDAPNISLEEAIRLIPSRARKEGQVITFLDREDHWHIYQFKGALNQWNILDTWEDLFDWEKLIIDSILPDEEDLTKSLPDNKGNSYLSLKDREYNTEDFSGLGRIILRKNIMEVEDPIYGKVKNNILYQDMINKSNTIYEIRYDFDLNGAEITIPENCVLDFQGGSFSNGIINNNSTVYIGTIHIPVLKEVKVKGTIVNNFTFPVNIDITEVLQNILDVTKYAKLSAGTYYISKEIVINNSDTKIIGSGRHNTIIQATASMDSMFRILRRSDSGAGQWYDVQMTTIKDLKLIGNKLADNGIINIGPSCIFEELYITQFNNVGINTQCWCTSISKCIITYCNIGIQLRQSHNNNITKNRIEANSIYDIYIVDSSAAIIEGNVLESGCKTNILAMACYGLKILGNYFEGFCRISEDEIKSTYSQGWISGLGTIYARICIIGAYPDIQNNQYINIASAYPCYGISIENNHNEGGMGGGENDALVFACSVIGLNIENNSSNDFMTALNIPLIYNTTLYNINIKGNVLSRQVGVMEHYKFLVPSDRAYYNTNQNESKVKGYFNIDKPTENVINNICLWNDFRTDSGKKSTFIEKYSTEEFILSISNEDGISSKNIGVVQRPYKTGLYCFEFDVKKTDGTSGTLKVELGRMLNGVHKCSNIQETIVDLGYTHNKIYYYIDNKFESDTFLCFSTSELDGTFYIKNPTFYRIGETTPQCNYTIINDRLYQNTYDNEYNTRGIPVGTIVQNTDKINRICVKTSDNFNVYDTYKPITEVINLSSIIEGSTINRPVEIAKGYQYFDTTINKPIWWTGEKWVDATGADV